MKYFQKIEKSPTKSWKSTQSEKCNYCKKIVDKKQDYFELSAHWKIKNKPDMLKFCSLTCLESWTKIDDEVDADDED